MTRRVSAYVPQSVSHVSADNFGIASAMTVDSESFKIKVKYLGVFDSVDNNTKKISLHPQTH